MSQIFKVCPSGRVLLNGTTFTPEDALCTIEMHADASVQDVLAMVQLAGTAKLVAEGGESDADGKSGGGNTVTTNDFQEAFKPEVVESLEGVGVKTFAQGAIYLRDHKTFAGLKHIGEATHDKLLEAIEQAGFTPFAS